MKRHSAFLLAALAAFPAAAQSPEAIEAAKRYAETPGVQSMIAEMTDPDIMAQGVMATLPPNVQLTDEQAHRIGQILVDAFAPLRPEIERVMIETTARHFTIDEISALTAFYESEHGAAIMAKMQPYMQDAMMQLGPQLAAVQTKVLPLIIQEIVPKQ